MLSILPAVPSCMYGMVSSLHPTSFLGMSTSSLVPRPSARGGGEEGLVHTACACALISRHSRNSVARADISFVTTVYYSEIRVP